MVQVSKFFPIARRLRLELNRLEGNNLVGGFIETLLAAWVTPFAGIGLIWLAVVTDFVVIWDNLLPLLLLLAALLVTDRQTFSIYIELEGGLDAGPISSLFWVSCWLIFWPII